MTTGKVTLPSPATLLQLSAAFVLASNALDPRCLVYRDTLWLVRQKCTTSEAICSAAAQVLRDDFQSSRIIEDEWITQRVSLAPATLNFEVFARHSLYKRAIEIGIDPFLYSVSAHLVVYVRLA